MKTQLLILGVAALIAGPATSFSAEAPKIGTVNMNKCFEESKIGKQEQENANGMRKQMEAVLEEKDKRLNKLAGQLNDEDFLDSISDEKETELKREFRTLSQEMGQIQNQYYQTIQQLQMKITQKMSETIAEASKKVAEDHKLDVVLNDQQVFFRNNKLDVTNAIVKEMDSQFDEKKAKDDQ